MPRSVCRALWPLLAGLAILVGACSDTQPDPDDQEVACAMLSDQTLTQLFGKTNLRSSGDLGTKAARQDMPARCEVSDRDTGESLMLITVFDATDEADARKQADRIARESAGLNGCDKQETLTNGGYLCLDETGLVAAAAMQERVVRLTLRGDAARSINADDVASLLAEVDKHATSTK